MTKVAFGISFGSGAPLPRREDTRTFQDLVWMAEDAGAEEDEFAGDSAAVAEKLGEAGDGLGVGDAADAWGDIFNITTDNTGAVVDQRHVGVGGDCEA